MSSTLPQNKYFENSYSLDETWSISGHSRALERTGFLLQGEGNYYNIIFLL